ncbi:MAG: mutT1 [Pseudonocardiales bacterium]|nr:mutT1 [Pseudonocardiales bacterium]
MSSTIKAAGGIVWRGPADDPQIAVIHRPHRSDWSLPKGKPHGTEPTIQAAHREVLEETGLHVAVQHQLGTVRYRLDGTLKVVSYWSMRHLGGDFCPNDEADKLLWLSPKEALEQLSFRADHKVVERFATGPAPDTTLLMVRHARAGKRSSWKKDDTIRPIDADGRRQAQSIGGFGELFGPTQIYSATPLRCRQTVEPLAQRLDLPVEHRAAFSDHDFEHDPAASIAALRQLALSRQAIVISSQGGAIPGLLDQIDPDRAPHDSRKGSIWALFFGDGELLHADYYGRPA